MVGTARRRAFVHPAACGSATVELVWLQGEMQTPRQAALSVQALRNTRGSRRLRVDEATAVFHASRSTMLVGARGAAARRAPDVRRPNTRKLIREPRSMFASPPYWLALAAALFLMEIDDMSNRAISFESNRTGVAPEGWTATLTGTGNPQWTVETDDTAPSGAKVIRQSGRATFPLLLKNHISIKDGFIEVTFKALAGAQDRAAGVVWRASDANNYYVARANALEDNFVLYKTVQGVRSALDIVGRKGGYGVSVPVPADIWHNLRVDFQGP